MRRIMIALGCLIGLAVPAVQATLVTIAPILLATRGFSTATTRAQLNAAGESTGIVGYVHLAGQTGSKTCSAAGGCVIYWNSSISVVFADAGTTLRVGLQDVAATGVEDGTFDVSADLVGGTDTIGSSVLLATAMDAATKTVSHGQLIAVVIEMTARGGTDLVSVARAASGQFPFGLPYGTIDIATLSKDDTLTHVLIRFDDATYGWIDHAPLLQRIDVAPTSIAFNSGSTPDEYAAVFEVPVPMTVTSLGFMIGNMASADTAEILLYSDPLGTPSVERTATPDPDQLISSTSNMLRFSITPFTVQPNTAYGVALRPTSVNSINWFHYDLTSGFDLLKVAQPFSVIQMAARTDQTGPFVETEVYHLPDILLGVGALDDGTSAGGAETSHVFIQ